MTFGKTKYRSITYEKLLVGFRNRFFQSLAMKLPGADSIRVMLHRRRGVEIGNDVFIGTDVLIDTSLPRKISIGSDVVIGMRATLIGHFGNFGAMHVTSTERSLIIEDQVFIGPGAIILPNVTIGRGSVVMAGSVVTKSVPPSTMVQGNPAVPVAKCGVPLLRTTPIWVFYRHLEYV